jgi:hypothetical protein
MPILTSQVIQEWADFDSAGYSFERGRMEKTVQSLCFGDQAAVMPAHLAAGPAQGQKLKKEDVEFIVSANPHAASRRKSARHGAHRRLGFA